MEKEKLKFEGKKVRRISTNAGRYYYEPKDPTKFYLGVTSWIKAVMPAKPYLEAWKIEISTVLGDKDLMKKYVGMTAAYGSTLDELVERMFNGEVITKDKVLECIISNMKSDKLFTQPDMINVWSKQITKGLLAIAEWARAVNYVPIASQVMILLDGVLGGSIDSFGYWDVVEKGFFGEVLKSGPNKGKPKETKRTVRKLGVLDLKTSKSFYEGHELQLVAYAKGLNQTYPELPPIEVLANIAPKRWRTTPTYLYKDQSNTKMKSLYDLYLELGKKTNVFEVNPTFIEINDVSLSGGANYDTYNLEQYLDLQNK